MTKQINAESKINVGITFFVSQQISSIWSNGTVQNVMFLYNIFKQSDRIGKVYLVNGGDSDVLPETLLPESMKKHVEVKRFDECMNELDVLIDFHVQVSVEQAQAFQQRGGKIIQYKSGNVFVMEMENSIFNLDRPNSVVNGLQYDATWTLPHHARTNKGYLETLYRTEVTIMPYIWDSVFLQWALDSSPAGKRYMYEPGQIGRSDKKRIAVLEPNFNIVKTCHYPILVCEEAYRAKPELISNVYINNIEHMRSQKNFIHFTHFLDITKDKIASYEGRFNTIDFMINHADMVVTHNWENQLNNLYFDLLYGNYPLIHNSEMLAHVGYYYEPFNTKDGARAIIQAITNHDANFEEYKERNKYLFNQLSIYNKDNINRHVEPLFSLFEKNQLAYA
ncbi:MAG: hypothetical protein RLZZ210_516 [Pseudomonadota bacterium]